MKQFTYDDSGKKTQEINNIYGASFPFITTYRYDRYDTAGNWLREEFIENGKVTSIVGRMIEYY